jgi:hypothetical protein
VQQLRAITDAEDAQCLATPAIRFETRSAGLLPWALAAAALALAAWAWMRPARKCRLPRRHVRMTLPPPPAAIFS